MILDGNYFWKKTLIETMTRWWWFVHLAAALFFFVFLSKITHTNNLNRYIFNWEYQHKHLDDYSALLFHSSSSFLSLGYFFYLFIFFSRVETQDEMKCSLSFFSIHRSNKYYIFFLSLHISLDLNSRETLIFSFQFRK